LVTVLVGQLSALEMLDGELLIIFEMIV